MQVDLCSMRMQEIYPTTAQLHLQHEGGPTGWVLFGSWSGVLVKPLDDQIVSKFSMQRIVASDAAGHTSIASSTGLPSRQPASAMHVHDGDSRGKQHDVVLPLPNMSIKAQGHQADVGYRLKEAMGAESDGTLEHTLRELSNHMEDLYAEQERQTAVAKMRADLAASHALRDRTAWQSELQLERDRADKYGAALERATEQIEALENRLFVLENKVGDRALETMERDLETVILNRETERLAALADKPRRDAEDLRAQGLEAMAALDYSRACEYFRSGLSLSTKHPTLRLLRTCRFDLKGRVRRSGLRKSVLVG